METNTKQREAQEGEESSNELVRMADLSISPKPRSLISVPEMLF